MSQFSFKAVIFDLDGVVTDTAVVHARAWKETFDAYLRMRAQRDGEVFREFTDEDYLSYVDGKPRYEGVRTFLESRNIHLDYGDPKDTPEKESICGIGNRKNKRFLEIIESEGTKKFDSTIAFINQLRQVGVRVGVASSSKSCQQLLKSIGCEGLFETRVDGVVSAQLGLQGKPEGDIFVKAAQNLGTAPAQSIVVEDATSGVQAGRNGGFQLVVGVARKNNTQELLDHGADVVVEDLGQITPLQLQQMCQRKAVELLPSWQSTPKVEDLDLGDIVKNPHIRITTFNLRRAQEIFMQGKPPVFFLDYDGTLTPIVDRPEHAVLSEDMREILLQLRQKFSVSVVSGRMREDVENLVGIEGIFYAGSHGFDIKGPGVVQIQPEAQRIIPLMDKTISEMKSSLSDIEGVVIEEKRFSVGLHYRLVDPLDVPRIQEYVNSVLSKNSQLRLLQGKKVFEIMPAIDWNKGKAIRWIMKALNITWTNRTIVYIGDDTTDEDAFRVVRTRGVGVLVSEENRCTAADFRLASPHDVKRFFQKILGG